MNGFVLIYLDLEDLIVHEDAIAILYYFLAILFHMVNDVYPYNCLYENMATCSYNEIKNINGIYAYLFPPNHIVFYKSKTDAQPQVMA